MTYNRYLEFGVSWTQETPNSWIPGYLARYPGNPEFLGFLGTWPGTPGNPEFLGFPGTWPGTQETQDSWVSWPYGQETPESWVSWPYGQETPRKPVFFEKNRKKVKKRVS